MINFLNLEYFLAAADELNFTRAAKKLYISQQSLSNHIAHMEKEFGVQLFNRSTPLTLTYAGQALKVRARQLLDIRDETYRELTDIKDFTIGRLTIGLSHTRGRFILPEILPLYKERFPNIDLRLLEDNFRVLENALLHGEIDLIIGMLPFHVSDVETVPICKEEVLLAVPNAVLERCFPGRLDEIRNQLEQHTDLKLLRDCPFLLINPGNRVRTLADEMFDEAQITPNIVLETENIETVLALAIKGLGITFYPKMFISGNQDILNRTRPDFPINFYSLGYPRANGVLAIGYHKGHYMTQATKEFIRIAKEKL
ncbi:MAG: LysR family transcriptional regulator [Clostridiales bacterium]|nr:LysR family transcriptional regulator [Clostridiales bacterium]